MTKLKVATIFIIAIVTMSTLGFAAFYTNMFQPVNVVSTNLSDGMATLSADDIVVDASIDDTGSDAVDTNQIDIPAPVSTPDTSINTVSLDQAKANNVVVNEPKSTSVTIRDPIDNTKKLVYGGTSPQCKTIVTVNDNGGNSTSNSTIINNGDFVRPTYDQLVSFLANDNTDTLALPDNTSVVQLAKNACVSKYHNEIVVLVFATGQVYAVNRFALNDGTFAYVDCSKITGVSSGTQALDRILTVHRNMPVTAVNPYQTSVVYTYPTINLMYGIPMWSI